MVSVHAGSDHDTGQLPLFITDMEMLYSEPRRGPAPISTVARQQGHSFAYSFALHHLTDLVSNDGKSRPSPSTALAWRRGSDHCWECHIYNFNGIGRKG